jgi:hypothetical protein
MINLILTIVVMTLLFLSLWSTLAVILGFIGRNSGIREMIHNRSEHIKQINRARAMDEEYKRNSERNSDIK